MSKTVFLHVGLPKSGTSYVQKILTGNRERFKEAGLLFPGDAWVDQVRAVQDVRQLQIAPGKRRVVRGAWGRLVAEISAWPGDAIVSMEWLGSASPEHIRVLVDDLSPARVQVIFTVRDLARTVPAAWQEFMQNRGEWTWQEFLEGVVADDPWSTSAGAQFWSQQDLEKLLGNWTSVVPRDQVHVVTLPHPGAGQEVLWQRVCQVLGDAYQGYVLDDVGSNLSLGLESAELMRRLNRLAREEGVRGPLYHQVFKHRLAKDVLVRRKGKDSRLALPPAYHEWARRRAAQQIKELEASGVHVVGHPQELQPVLAASAGRQPSDVPAEVLLEICLRALITMARQWSPARGAPTDLRSENARLQDRVQQFESSPGRTALGLYARAARARVSALRRDRD